MLPHIEVLTRLDHRRFHSGQDLAEALGVTCATIHNCILRLEQMGVAVERIRGKGYRLRHPLDALSAAGIKSKLILWANEKLECLEVLQEVDSTNDYIRQWPLPSKKHFSVVLAEMQTAGKGRRGRCWQSPFGANIYMSLLWPLQKSLSETGALSAMLAISVVRALAAMGISRLGLKWPNDIYCQGKKLAGLLLECSCEINGTSRLIIGCGINVWMSRQKSVQIDQQWTDIHSQIPMAVITRNEVIAAVISQMVTVLDQFERARNDSHVREWARWDIMHDKPVTLHGPNRILEGVARGIDSQGCLLLDTHEGLQHISAGDVSLRGQQ